MFYCRVYNDAKQQQGDAFKLREWQLEAFRDMLPEGWTIVARRCV